jgi:hypothetical protein
LAQDGDTGLNGCSDELSRVAVLASRLGLFRDGVTTETRQEDSWFDRLQVAVTGAPLLNVLCNEV